MSQYLIAVWDYEAEGEFELSFKQGDRIKLLEKHNDDWWEGELNDEIGVFPANRIRLETKEELDAFESNQVQTKNVSTNNADSLLDAPPELPARRTSRSNPQSFIQSQSASSITTNDSTSHHILNTQEYTDSPLPNGWESAYDQDGTIYFFNETTGESRWDKPTSVDSPQEVSTLANERDDAIDYRGLQPLEINKLEFEKLKPDWIRHKGYIQMKMLSDKEEGGKLSSWKVYYAILSKGFLLLYKEGHTKGSKKSSKPHLPVGTFDLDSCKIEPAGKQDTKRKHVFIISSPKKVRIYIQTTSDKEFSTWLDDIMRELVARKEGQNDDQELMRLLRSLSIDESQMKVNRKMLQEHPEDNKKSIGNWFSSSKSNKSGSDHSNSSSNVHRPEPKYAYGQKPPSNDDDVFGGYLHMEENGDIPYIVTECVKEVEARGLKSVGIYRLSGPASTIQKYKSLFNKKLHVSFKDENDINVVTGLLKSYFRELRIPLMTYDYYEWFIEAAKMTDYEERMYQIKSILHTLPKPNYTVLKYLMRHLNLVASYCEINKMESSNLALIFSVGLLRSPQEDLSSIMMSDLHSQIIEAIIQQVDWFFEDVDEDQEELGASIPTTDVNNGVN